MNMVLRKKRSAPKAVPVEYKDIPFTSEREKKLVAADIDIGDDKRGTKIWRIKDTAEKLKDSKKITFALCAHFSSLFGSGFTFKLNEIIVGNRQALPVLLEQILLQLLKALCTECLESYRL